MSKTQLSCRQSSRLTMIALMSELACALNAQLPTSNSLITGSAERPGGQHVQAASRHRAHIRPILHVALLPHAGLLAISGCQAVF